MLELISAQIRQRSEKSFDLELQKVIELLGQKRGAVPQNGHFLSSYPDGVSMLILVKNWSFSAMGTDHWLVCASRLEMLPYGDGTMPVTVTSFASCCLTKELGYNTKSVGRTAFSGGRTWTVLLWRCFPEAMED